MISKGWLLYKSPVGETSNYLCFLTEDFGVVQCRFKGSRHPKKQALLQSFMPLWIDFSSRYSLYFIKTVESLAPMHHLSGKALFCALYLNELIYYSLQPMDSHRILFNTYQETLQALKSMSTMEDLEQSLRRFEWILLKECGYQLVESQLSSYKLPADIVLSILQGSFSRDSLKAAKVIMREAIQVLVDGRELKTRRLFVTK